MESKKFITFDIIYKSQTHLLSLFILTQFHVIFTGKGVIIQGQNRDIIAIVSTCDININSNIFLLQNTFNINILLSIKDFKNFKFDCLF